MVIAKNKKDTIALLVILYFLPLCFWFGNRNSIRSVFDFYIFVIASFIMCILPIVVLEVKHKYGWGG